jgi:hypothetical protein
MADYTDLIIEKVKPIYGKEFHVDLKCYIFTYGTSYSYTRKEIEKASLEDWEKEDSNRKNVYSAIMKIWKYVIKYPASRWKNHTSPEIAEIDIQIETDKKSYEKNAGGSYVWDYYKVIWEWNGKAVKGTFVSGEDRREDEKAAEMKKILGIDSFDIYPKELRGVVLGRKTGILEKFMSYEKYTESQERI